MGALFKYNNMPVCDICVILPPAWSLSKKQLTSTGLSRGGVELGGKYSTLSGKFSSSPSFELGLRLDILYYDIMGQKQAHYYNVGQGI